MSGRFRLGEAYLVLTCTGGAIFGGIWGLSVGAHDRDTNGMTKKGKIMWDLVYIPSFTIFGAFLGGLFGPLAPFAYAGKWLANKTEKD